MTDQLEPRVVPFGDVLELILQRNRLHDELSKLEAKVERLERIEEAALQFVRLDDIAVELGDSDSHAVRESALDELREALSRAGAPQHASAVELFTAEPVTKPETTEGKPIRTRRSRAQPTDKETQ